MLILSRILSTSLAKRCRLFEVEIEQVRKTMEERVADLSRIYFDFPFSDVDFSFCFVYGFFGDVEERGESSGTG